MAVNPPPPSAAFPASSPFSASAPFLSANPPMFSASAPADSAAPSPVRPHKPTGRHGATDQQRRRELALERQRAARRDLQLHARHVALAATGAVTLAEEIEARESAAAAAPETKEVSPLLPEICEFDQASGQWTRIDQEGFKIDGSGRRIEQIIFKSDGSSSRIEQTSIETRIHAAEGESTEAEGALEESGGGEGVLGMVREAGGEGMEMDGEGAGEGEEDRDEDRGDLVGIEQEMRGLFVPRGEAGGRRGKGGAGGGGRGESGGAADAERGVIDGAREWYAQQLMLPEWMVDVPPRLASDWFVMPRPDGRRCLVVSANGTTVSRLRNGRIHHRFPSHLPNGARAPGIAAGSHVYCILDCIFHEPNSTYYVLDVMAWRGYSLYDCTAEFRLFWLHTHLPQCGACDPPSHFHRFRFAPTPFFECHRQGLEAAYCGWREAGGGAAGAGGAGEARGAGGEMGGVEGAGMGAAAAGTGRAASVGDGSADGMVNGAPVPAATQVEFTRDGLLFYNRHSHYTLGLSPLVLQWKDATCSRFIIDTDGSGKIPERQQVVLLLAADGSLVTSDDPPVVFGSLPPHTLNDPSLHLRPNKLLRFAIGPGGLHLEQGRVVGADLLLQGAANQRRGGADSCSKILFQYAARHSPLTIQDIAAAAVAASVAREEASLKVADGSRVTVGVLSKWVHIGRGWAPRLFLLRQRHLLYFKLRGSATAAMIQKLRQRYDHAARLSFPVPAGLASAANVDTAATASAAIYPTAATEPISPALSSLGIASLSPMPPPALASAATGGNDGDDISSGHADVDTEPTPSRISVQPMVDFLRAADVSDDVIVRCEEVVWRQVVVPIEKALLESELMRMQRRKGPKRGAGGGGKREEKEEEEAEEWSEEEVQEEEGDEEKELFFEAAEKLAGEAGEGWEVGEGEGSQEGGSEEEAGQGGEYKWGGGGGGGVGGGSEGIGGGGEEGMAEWEGGRGAEQHEPMEERGSAGQAELPMEENMKFASPLTFPFPPPTLAPPSSYPSPPSHLQIGFSYPFVPRRTRLPLPDKQNRPGSLAGGLWAALRECVGRDLSRVCLPVQLNEPIGLLHKCAEEMEYSWLLDRAAEHGRRGDQLMRALHVAAFAMSGYANTSGRMHKPFNPLLGETYEASYPDKGFKLLAEKTYEADCSDKGFKLLAEKVASEEGSAVLGAVNAPGAVWSHLHPPSSPFPPHFSPFLPSSPRPSLQVRFWGPSMHLVPCGLTSTLIPPPLFLHPYSCSPSAFFHSCPAGGGERYEWSKVTTGIYNIIVGKLQVEHFGTMHIRGSLGLSVHLHFKEPSLFDRSKHQVREDLFASFCAAQGSQDCWCICTSRSPRCSTAASTSTGQPGLLVHLHFKEPSLFDRSKHQVREDLFASFCAAQGSQDCWCICTSRSPRCSTAASTSTGQPGLLVHLHFKEPSLFDRSKHQHRAARTVGASALQGALAVRPQQAPGERRPLCLFLCSTGQPGLLVHLHFKEPSLFDRSKHQVREDLFASFCAAQGSQDCWCICTSRSPSASAVRPQQAPGAWTQWECGVR
ncbi:unnamed protein product [Closterium sp. Yama58-4]|nr:unnamed protein product [Closterium sp. Yama58-4]